MLTDEERGQIKRLIKQAKYPVRQVTLCCQLYAAKWEDVLECLPEGFEWIRKYQGRSNDFTRRCCLEWLAGGSSREIADRMCTSVNSARGRMRSYMKHHPDEFVGVEDKRGRK